MKYEKYTSLINGLEEFAAVDPKGYERRVAALTALGYAYFAGLIFLFLIAPLALVVLVILVPKLLWIVINVAGKLIIVILIALASAVGAVWGMVRSLWATIPPPEGHELSADDVPLLYETVERVARELSAPKPDKILLIEDFNAAVVTLPRFGVFGSRVYLLVGLPLLQALSPEQLDAVIAHEIGHVSERHGKTGARAVRLGETWGRFIESQEVSGHDLSFLYRSFLNWYVPYFEAYSFVLRRQQEKRADEYAVQFAGAKPLGEALINLNVKSLNLSENFWKGVLDKAARDSAPPAGIFTQMANAFRENNRDRDTMNLSKAVAINTGYDDSHPCLADRLKAIGYWKGAELPELPAEVAQTAAAKYLGPLESKYSTIFNDLWRERVRDDWRKRHEHLATSRNKIAELDKKAQTETLTPDERIERVTLIADCDGEAAALEAVKAVLAEHPEDAVANFLAGNYMLMDDQEEGCDLVKKAMSLDSTLNVAGCDLLAGYLRSKGRDDEAKAFILAIEAEQENLESANRERSRVFATDSFEVHDWPAERVERLVNRIKYYDEILAIYLVKKVVKFYATIPMYVVLIEKRPKNWIGDGTTLSSPELIGLLHERAGEFGVNVFAVLDNELSALKDGLDKLAGAEIYRA